MISLEEFREDYINEINLTAIENSEHQPDAFIDEMSETLIEDFSIINGLDRCFYSFNKGTKAFKNMQIDGGFLDLPANVIDLLIADYNPGDVTTITNEFINSKSQLMINYFENVLKGYFTNAEDSNEAVQLAYSILNNLDSINKIHLVIISTNKLSTRVKTIDFPDFIYNNRKFKVELDVIDIQMIYNSRLKDFKKEPVVINTADFGLNGIQCIKADIGTSDYEAYLAIVPGKFLCDIYEKYGPRLLESNVRSFLNAKGAEEGDRLSSGRGGFRLRYGHCLPAVEGAGNFRADAEGRRPSQRVDRKGQQSHRTAQQIAGPQILCCAACRYRPVVRGIVRGAEQDQRGEEVGECPFSVNFAGGDRRLSPPVRIPADPSAVRRGVPLAIEGRIFVYRRPRHRVG